MKSTTRTTIDIDLIRRYRQRPAPPGEYLREFVLPELKMTQEQLAKCLGVSRRAINELINGKRGVTVDMALRLGKVLGNGPEWWLRVQQLVDLWDAYHRHKDKYDKLKPLSKGKAA